MRPNQSMCPECGSCWVSVEVPLDNPWEPISYQCVDCNARWDRTDDWEPGDS